MQDFFALLSKCKLKSLSLQLFYPVLVLYFRKEATWLTLALSCCGFFFFFFWLIWLWLG